MAKIIKYSISFIVLSIIILLGILYYKLLTGINLKNISLPHTNIKELYIKIDKKLIFKVKNIKINKPSSQEPINFYENIKIVKNILQYLSFFEEINIKNLSYNDTSFNSITLKNEQFKIDDKFVNLTASLIPNKNKIKYIITNLYIKPKNITIKNINGYFYADLRNLYVLLNFKYHNSKLNAHIKVSNKTIEYRGVISNITNQTLLPFKLKNIKLDIPKIKFNGNKTIIKLTFFDNKIFYNKIKIKLPKFHIDYNIINKLAIANIDNLYIDSGKFHIYSNNDYIKYKKDLIIKTPMLEIKNKDMDTKLFHIQGNYDINKTIANINIQNTITNYKNDIITASNIKINYNKFVNINIPFVELKNKDIDTKLFHIKGKYDINKTIANINIANTITNYKNIDINSSTIKILYDKNTTINIPLLSLNNIKLTNNKIIYDKSLKIKFNTQTLLSKKLNSILKVFNIDIPIYQKTGKNNINGNLTINLDNLKTDTILDINTTNSKLMVTPSTCLNIHKANLKMINDKIYLKNTDLDYNQSIINLNYFIKNGLIDLNKSLITTNGKFNILDMQNILKIKDYNETLKIDLNNMIFNLPELHTSIKINNNIVVQLNKLSIFQPYIDYLHKYNIKGKSIINIANNINIDTNITDTNQTIILANNHYLKKLNLSTKIQDKNITLKNKYINLTIHNDKNISIKGAYANLDFNVTSFVKKDTNQTKNENNETNKSIHINIDGYNTAILFDNHKLYSHKLTIKIKDKNISISSLDKDRNISFIKNGKSFTAYGINIKDKTFKDLTHTKILNDPNIIFYAYSPDSKLIGGFVEIKKGYIKELKAFNNIIAFINLVPSLVTFQAVGFSNKGYKIKKGHIDFLYKNHILYFKKLSIKGENITFNGQGYVNFKTKKIKMNVNVNLLVKLIKDIPIVNYILLGKDGGITLKLTIDGNLDNPKVHKNTISNIISAPFDIIKRTLLTPFRPFMKDK